MASVQTWKEVRPPQNVLQCSAGPHRIQNPHRLKTCLHSFCKKCIDGLPLQEKDNQKGWFCPQCDTFAEEHQLKSDYIIKQMLDLENRPRKRRINSVCGQCNHTLGTDQWECRDCSQLLCYQCKVNDHHGHSSQTAYGALQQMVPQFKTHHQKNIDKCKEIQIQLDTITSKNYETRESFAIHRRKLDDQLEKVICQLRAAKSEMDEELVKQETIALDNLDQLKKNLEIQKSILQNLNTLSEACLENSKDLSLLAAFNDGVYSAVMIRGSEEVADVKYEIPEVNFTEGNLNADQLKKVIGKVQTEMNQHCICKFGSILNSKCDPLLMDDFNNIKSLQFQNEYLIKECGCTNRISLIDNQIWMPYLEKYSCSIDVFSNEQQKKFKNIEIPIYSIVKMKATDTFICGGAKGLHITDKELSKFKLLAEGEFSDIILSDDHFFAFRYDEPSVYRFCYNSDSNEDTRWRQCRVIQLQSSEGLTYNFDANSTIYVNELTEYMITSSENTSNYVFNDKGELLRYHRKSNAEPTFCGNDKSGRAIISNYNNGALYTVTSSTAKSTKLSRVCKGYTFHEVRDIAINESRGELYLWVMRGCLEGSFTLTNYKIIKN